MNPSDDKAKTDAERIYVVLTASKRVSKSALLKAAFVKESNLARSIRKLNARLEAEGAVERVASMRLPDTDEWTYSLVTETPLKTKMLDGLDKTEVYGR